MNPESLPKCKGSMRVGKFLLLSGQPGVDGNERIWLLHDDGEAMETTPAKIEALLQEFWEREF